MPVTVEPDLKILQLANRLKNFRWRNRPGIPLKISGLPGTCLCQQAPSYVRAGDRYNELIYPAQDWGYYRKGHSMSTYFFKTNINCLGCVTQIKPHMDRLEQEKHIEHWHIDFNSPEHLLKVETIKMSPEQVKHYVREAGFEAEFTRAPQAR